MCFIKLLSSSDVWTLTQSLNVSGFVVFVNWKCVMHSGTVPCTWVTLELLTAVTAHHLLPPSISTPASTRAKAHGSCSLCYHGDETAVASVDRKKTVPPLAFHHCTGTYTQAQTSVACINTRHTTPRPTQWCYYKIIQKVTTMTANRDYWFHHLHLVTARLLGDHTSLPGHLQFICRTGWQRGLMASIEERVSVCLCLREEMILLKDILFYVQQYMFLLLKMIPRLHFMSLYPWGGSINDRDTCQQNVIRFNSNSKYIFHNDQTWTSPWDDRIF